MSISLLLDTSSDIFSVSLFNNNESISTFTNECSTRCSRLIFDFIIEELEKSCIKINDIDYFGVSTGPGSYTGIRVGVSFCLGVCEALKKPLVNINILDALEFFYKNKTNVVYPIINAKNNNIYTLVDKNVCKISIDGFKGVLSTRKDDRMVKIISSFNCFDILNISGNNIEYVVVDNISKIMFNLFNKKVENNEFCDIYNYNINYFDN